MRKIDKFKGVLHKWLYVQDDSYVDVIFGVIFANRLKTSPTWLHIVAPPGRGKTEVLGPLDGHRSIKSISSLTPHTLASGRRPDPDEEDPSLLATLNHKILVVKDFTVILKKRWEDVAEICGQLRDCYDGKYEAVFGSGKKARYIARFGIITGVTEVIYDHMKLLAALGERFLIYQMPELSKEERSRRGSVAFRSMWKDTKDIREYELGQAAYQMMEMREKEVALPLEREEEFKRLSEFVATARTPVTRERESKELKNAYTPEEPTRLIKQLGALAKGICMARQMETVDEYVMGLVRKVGLESIPPKRMKTMRVLMDWEGERVRPTAVEVGKQMRINKKTAQRWLEDLYLLGVVHMERQGIDGSGPHVFGMKKEWVEVLNKTPK
jgi:hypothetical protein